MKKIDIGSGRSKYFDYITVDKDPLVNADFCLDIEDVFLEDLPGKLKEADEIRAHHILEHFKPENKVKMMMLFHDMLKDGGILDIEVPVFPHPASVQDPTHLSFWCKESFKYFIKGDPFGEAFAKRHSDHHVILFQFVKEWYRADWGYGIKLKKI